MNRIRPIVSLVFIFASLAGFGQAYNYKAISIQGQLMNSQATQVDLEFRVYDYSNTLLWNESHGNILLSDQKSFDLMLGQGTYIAGTVALFENMNWLNAERIEAWRTDAGTPYLILSMNIYPVPYALHSLHNLYIPFTYELVDNPNPVVPVGYVLKFDGTAYYLAPDIVSDTVDFAWYTPGALYADTAGVAITNANTADTSEYSPYADSASYSSGVIYAGSAGSATYADSTNTVPYSTGNWGFTGNAGLSAATNAVGTSTSELFRLRTNNSTRLVFGPDNSIYNSTDNGGFSLFTTRGAVFQTNATPGLSTINGSALYFDGQQAAFFGGETSYNLDTAMGQYSFAWGKDVGTNGANSTVFGYNTIGDSAFAFGATYDAISAFAFGRNCKAGNQCVAIGDSCIALYYRNVAIGKNVVASSNSASVGIGRNIVSTGSTSWAAGYNVSATGHFSTAMGSYANSTTRASFVYGDNSTTSIVTPNVNYQFIVRASGGYVFYTDPNLTMGVELLPGGGSWNMISDKNKKENITQLDYTSISPVIRRLELFSWQYIGSTVGHVGPMAQDFNGAFGVGELPNYLNMIDSDGVIFWGIKSLHEQIQSESVDNAEIECLEEEIQTEKEEYEELLNRINTLYEKVDK